MKSDIILAGVGGQGVLSIAAVIGWAAVEAELHLKQAEVHGMAQRGGAVQSHLRMSDYAIHSDLIPAGQADLLLSMEPMEALRYVSFLSSRGVIVAECAPVINVDHYPPIEEVHETLERFPRVRLVDAEDIARGMRASKSSNMVLLGAASPFLPLSNAQLEDAIQLVFARKGEAVVEQNLAAFRAGCEISVQTQ